MVEPEYELPHEEAVEEEQFIIDRNIRYGIPKGFVLRESQQDFWPNVALGIALAEGFLPLVLILLEKVLAQGSPFPVFFPYMILMLCLMLVIGFTLGLLFNLDGPAAHSTDGDRNRRLGRSSAQSQRST